MHDPKGCHAVYPSLLMQSPSMPAVGGGRVQDPLHGVLLYNAHTCGGKLMAGKRSGRHRQYLLHHNLAVYVQYSTSLK